MTKTPGQIAYEEDVRRCPAYHSGSARLPWDKLPKWAQGSWEQQPTPRDYKNLQVTA